MKQTLNNQRGMALLLVLVIVALLSALLTELAFSTLVDLRLAETFRDSTRAAYLAKGGVRVGRALLQEDRNAWDHKSEFWGIGVARYPVGDGDITVTIVDQDGKFNLNRLVVGGVADNVFKQRCNKLFLELDLPDPEDLTAALIDWIDADDTVYTDPQTGATGAEESYYQGLKNPTRCKNAPFDSLEELAGVRGFTPEVRGALIEFVTVYGVRQLNVNTAPKQVLYAWYGWANPALDDKIANTIFEACQTAPIKDKSELIALIGTNDFTILNQQSDIAYSSTTFHIESKANIHDDSGGRKVEAMIGKSGDKLLYLKVN
jgi:general secretion pathway protein K